VGTVSPDGAEALLARAREEAARILREAADRARELEQAVAKAEQTASGFRERFDEAYRQQLEELARQKPNLDRREIELNEESGWLAEERKRLKKKEEDLLTRDARCSEAAVVSLERDCRDLKDKLQSRVEENDSLRRELAEARRQLYASGTPNLLEENVALRKRVEELERCLRDLPSSAELARLRRRAEEADLYEAEARDLRTQLGDLQRLQAAREQEAALAGQYRGERDTYKLITEHLRDQKKELEETLGELKSRKAQPFANFAALAGQDDLKPRPGRTGDGRDLKALAGRVRQWMASRPPREEALAGRGDGAAQGPDARWFAHFYDEHTVRSMLAAMASSRLIIIQGVSGTGKTSLPEYFARAVGGRCARVEVQSSWRDKADLVGLYNSFFRQFNETPFCWALYEAGSNRWYRRPYFILLDEMNLSRVEYYFADFLSLLEGSPETREVELLSHDPTAGNLPPRFRVRSGAVKLPIPDNVWFVGTANTDESTYEITRKVYDRAGVLQFDEVPKPHRLPPVEPAELEFGEFTAAVSQAVQTFRKVERDTAENGIRLIDECLREYFQEGCGQRLIDQLFTFLPIYRASGGSLGEGLDHFIARKMLWQVIRRQDPNARSGLEHVGDVVKVVLGPHGRAAGTSVKELERAVSRLA
jgi:hypothetical protein